MRVTGFGLRVFLLAFELPLIAVMMLVPNLQLLEMHNSGKTSCIETVTDHFYMLWF